MAEVIRNCIRWQQERKRLEMVVSKILQGQEPAWNLQRHYIGHLSATPGSYKRVLTRIDTHYTLTFTYIVTEVTSKKPMRIWNSKFCHSTSLDVILLIKLDILLLLTQRRSKKCCIAIPHSSSSFHQSGPSKHSLVKTSGKTVFKNWLRYLNNTCLQIHYGRILLESFLESGEGRI